MKTNEYLIILEDMLNHALEWSDSVGVRKLMDLVNGDFTVFRDGAYDRYFIEPHHGKLCFSVNNGPVYYHDPTAFNGLGDWRLFLGRCKVKES